MNTPTGTTLSEHFARPSDRPRCEVAIGRPGHEHPCGRPSATFADRLLSIFAGREFPYRSYYCARHANAPDTPAGTRIVATGTVVVDRPAGGR